MLKHGILRVGKDGMRDGKDGMQYNEHDLKRVACSNVSKLLRAEHLALSSETVGPLPASGLAVRAVLACWRFLQDKISYHASTGSSCLRL